MDRVRAEPLSAAELYNEYPLKSRPYLLEGAASRWPAIQKWINPEYLIERYGHKSALARLGIVSLRPKPGDASQPKRDIGPFVNRQVMPFADLLNGVLAP